MDIKMEDKEFNFKKEIRKIPINSREEQIILIVEEKFDEFIKLLKNYQVDQEIIIHEDNLDKLAGKDLI